MLTYHNNAETVFIVLHEIYGINSHIRQVCTKLAQYGADVIAPDLYAGGEVFGYDQEAAAYEFFIKKVGFEAAYRQANKALYEAQTNYKQVYVLGYSVGATLAWRCSAACLCDGVIGFYGSRIRDYLALTPKCPVLLFFPEQEKSFSVDELMSQVNNHKNVQVIKLAGMHGFADAFSPMYHKESAKQACKEIITFMRQIC